MINAGIQNGDILIVAVDRKITVKRLQTKGKKIYLKAKNTTFTPIEISKEMNFKILGIVTHVIHDLQKSH